jgi:hypothetical protein
MRKKLLLLVAICAINLTFGQFYVSGSAGYALGSAGVKFGEKVTVTKSESTYGSYGEGANFQLRGGYFFNDTWGVDLGFAYLHGADQTIADVNVPSQQVDAVARARAFGLSPSVVYKFTNKIYGRFGALLKAGGKTEAVAYKKEVFSDAVATGLGLPSGSYSETNYKIDFHGKLPLGFVGALGYKHNLSKNLGLFVEAEYLGISVKRKDSEFTEFNTDIVLPDGTVAIAGYNTLDNLPDGYVKKTAYVDSLDNATIASNGNDPYPAKKLSETVPYSSFGINFGITYTFGEK